MTEVGFELYTRLLQESIAELRGAPKAAEVPEVVVDLALSTAIPDDYIPSRQRKLETYRRIAELRELGDLVALREELRDRYGPPPEPMRNLLYGVEVKLRAIRAGAVEVRARGPEIRVTLGADATEAQKRAVRQAFPRAVMKYSSWPAATMRSSTIGQSSYISRSLKNVLSYVRSRNRSFSSAGTSVISARVCQPGSGGSSTPYSAANLRR